MNPRSDGDSFHIVIQDRGIEWIVFPFPVCPGNFRSYSSELGARLEAVPV